MATIAAGSEITLKLTGTGTTIANPPQRLAGNHAR
jgi:hypothetical protein